MGDMDYVAARARLHNLRLVRAGLGVRSQDQSHLEQAMEGSESGPSEDATSTPPNDLPIVSLQVYPDASLAGEWDGIPPMSQYIIPEEFHEPTTSGTAAHEGSEHGNGDDAVSDLEPTVSETDDTWEDEERVQLLIEAILTTKMSRETFKVETDLASLSGVKAHEIAMCPTGCMLFYGTTAERDVCSRCGASRLGNTGGIRRSFTYLSPIHRLRSLYRNPKIAAMLLYRANREHYEDVLSDIFDGQHYIELAKSDVKWRGKLVHPPRRYFDRRTDVALMLGTDGVPLFKRKGLSIWPIMLTILSLPPQLRYRKEYQICCGLIPVRLTDDETISTRFDSFLKPLIDDLETLATTGKAIRGWVNGTWTDFALKAHLLGVTGDMPAIAKVMNFKGIGAKFPCRWCKLESSRPKGAKSYYSISSQTTAGGGRNIIPSEARTDTDIKHTAKKIRNAAPEDTERLRKQSGIIGETQLYAVDSVNFPTSFPVDIMHLLFENIIKELLSIWEGTFKAKQVTGDPDHRLPDDFVISQQVWKEIDRDILGSNTTVPLQMARHISSIRQRSWWTADTYSYFLMYLGPILLKNRLPAVYYKHFVQLSTITKDLVKTKLLRSDLDSLERRIEVWVAQFERLYYRDREQYISLCTAPVHAMLHVTHCLRTFGPPSYYWCFSIERYAAWAKQVMGSRKHPVQAITNRNIKEEQIYELQRALIRDSAQLKRFDLAQIHHILNTLPPSIRYKLLSWSEPNRIKRTPPEPDDLEDKAPKLRDPILFSPTNEVIWALRKFFTAREYSNYNRHPSVAQVDVVASIPPSSWTIYYGGSQKANQTWRTAANRREKEKRDASWTLFYQVEDLNARSYALSVPTEFSSARRQWGKIVHFLEMDWRGESLTLAIIEPHDVERFIDEVSLDEDEYCPMKLGRKRPLQVVETAALGAVAARVKCSHLQLEVIFETSLGACKPDFYDE